MFRWGFIGVFRADNGSPFGDPSRQALSALNLHLIALGIRVKLNPPRSPTKNAKVERNQGTTNRWADPPQCANYLELQARLDQVLRDQRDHYATRTCAGKTRAQQYPLLFQNPKRFHPCDFEIQRLYDYLAKGSWQRKVSAQGVITLFAQYYQVGYAFRGTTISIAFDPLNVQWVFKTQKGVLIKSCRPSNLDEHTVFDISNCQ
jgi:hypothetical protein